MLVETFSHIPDPKSLPYSAPRFLKITEIPCVVVNPHNDVFESWYKFGSATPSVVVHVDKHRDMAPALFSMEALKTDSNTITLRDYSREYLGIADFICAARYYNRVGPIYWINPRNQAVGAHGRVIDGRFTNLLSAITTDLGIGWELPGSKASRPLHIPISYNRFIEDLRRYRGPLIIDIDLDAFDCVDDLGCESIYRRAPVGKDISFLTLTSPTYLDLVKARVDMVVNLLAQLPKPGLITIARSQSNRVYTPPERVDILELSVIAELKRIYRQR